MPEISYLAVLVAGIANMVVGYIWFGPLFGKMWMQGMGWNTNDPAKMAELRSKSMTSQYLQQFIAALLMAYVMSHVVWGMNAAFLREADFMSGVSTGFWMWLGFALPLKYGESLWTGKKFKFVAIDLGYWLVVLVVMGIILSVM
jgi:hypothetical protein